MSFLKALYKKAPPFWQEPIRRVYVWAYFKKKQMTAGYYKSRNCGSGTKVDRDAVVLGWRNVRLGRHVMISEGVVLNVNNRDEKIRISMGDYSAINRDCYFVNGSSIKLGEFTLFGPGCRLLGGNHKINSPFIPYVASGNTDIGDIIIGPNCWLGAGVTILGNVSVGFGSVIGANSFVLKDVPPFSLVVGNPAQVKKRYSPIRGEWVTVSDFGEDDANSIPDEAEYLAGLMASSSKIVIPFAASGRSTGDLA